MLKRICCCLVAKLCPTLATLRTVVLQASLSMGFPRQEYWSGLPFPPPGDPLDSGIEPTSPALQADSLLLSHQGSPPKSEDLNVHNLSAHSWNFDLMGVMIHLLCQLGWATII